MSLISIITPAYNSAKYIGETIQSVLDQSYKSWELIIINDGSTDNTEEIVKEFSDKRIRYFKQENKGVSAARNLGLSNMLGDFFCFLDADDVFPEKSLESRVTQFLGSPKLVFLDGQVGEYNIDLSMKLSTRSQTFKGNPFHALIALDSSCFMGLSWMIRRDYNREYLMPSGLTHCEDLLFFMELSREGGDYQAIETEILKYRRGHVSAMSNLHGLKKGYQEVYKRICTYNEVLEEERQFFKRKTRSIMVKSYLANFQILKAISCLWM